MRAVPKVTAAVDKVDNRKVRELAGELADRIGEASALVNATNIICATTSLDAGSLDRLRHVVLVALRAIVEAGDVSDQLSRAVRQ